ncbi:MAG: IS30 family transposase [Eubacteriaceae bacterium]|nr:IS30 family transposase [Eubacteriaceae bacterium]
MENVYYADVGQRLHDAARQNSRKPLKIAQCSDFIAEVDSKIAGHGKKCGPDGFVGALRAYGGYDRENSVCTKTVYKYISAGLMETKTTDLPNMLKRRPSRKAQAARKNKTKLGKGIEERPQEAEGRQAFGHWEGDLIIGSKSGQDEALLTLTERLTRYTLVWRLLSRQALDTAAGLLQAICHIGANAFKTVTLDNGSEFAGVSEALGGLGIEAYFCHPYSSWEKGSVERHNAMVRQYVPKGAAISQTSDGRLLEAEEHMNTLPRKLLGYKTPEEIFDAHLDRIGEDSGLGTLSRESLRLSAPAFP